jgi:hypothetical protein
LAERTKPEAAGGEAPPKRYHVLKSATGRLLASFDTEEEAFDFIVDLPGSASLYSFVDAELRPTRKVNAMSNAPKPERTPRLSRAEAMRQETARAAREITERETATQAEKTARQRAARLALDAGEQVASAEKSPARRPSPRKLDHA